jgi:hypothetical protein
MLLCITRGKGTTQCSCVSQEARTQHNALAYHKMQGHNTMLLCITREGYNTMLLFITRGMGTTHCSCVSQEARAQHNALVYHKSRVQHTALVYHKRQGYNTMLLCITRGNTTQCSCVCNIWFLIEKFLNLTRDAHNNFKMFK